MSKPTILTSLLDSGAIRESDVLIALHKTGTFDVPKLIKETVQNYGIVVDDTKSASETASQLYKEAAKLEENAVKIRQNADLLLMLDEDEDTARLVEDHDEFEAEDDIVRVIS